MLAKESASTKSSPEDLLRQIRSGDKNAEQELVTTYWRGLYFILNRRANDPELAADITQEAFIVVINKAREGLIENPGALPAFIRQVGVNLLIANYRKESRHKTETNENIDIQFPEVCNSTLDKLNVEKICQLVGQVLEELPTERDKELLRRFFLYGQDKTQLCEEFELSLDHFDRVLYRARNRLKQLLEHKLNIDLKSTSLSNLLSIYFISFFLLFPAATDVKAESKTFFCFQVRDIHLNCHLDNKRLMAKISYQLNARMQTQQLRWQQ